MTRRLPPVDSAKEKIINDILRREEPMKSANVSKVNDAGASIDDLILKGKLAIERLLIIINTDISSGAPSRDTVMNLRDCMNMLHELKKKEEDLLNGASDEELEKLLNKSR